jgi:diguanylate cyclase (GGDEF)-like protein
VVRNELRDDDLFVRLGGDEFGVVFSGRNSSLAAMALTGIYDRLSRTPLRFGESTRPLSVSCGLADLARGDTIETAKARADQALYEAKRQGRGRFVTTTPHPPSAPSPLTRGEG